ncbi:glucoamylase family protein [Nakamurella multipartita]|uniref:Uncharacterized protein n=1 Tax=Nakamurella multipartita (strain ATCC 700099 / DSM 44233 / CIP 104796 / JCM 9543 / NBRC 105858 / Y-104) TaxID=479431 RepID=C8X760_NAKMY|nr:glucoamylase family protein [Nakamurella multipartita]ACV76929.1 hypothetical protein Namu_0510 [Nakamurella multipartita DSM 44233]
MTSFNRRTLLIGGAAVAAAGAFGITTSTAAADPRPPGAGGPGPRPGDGLPAAAVRQVRRWAADTWASLVAMTDERTGLTADNIDGPLAAPHRSGYTSPTNIGGYLWSAIVARELGLISKPECSSRIRSTLRTLSTMTRHEPSGMFYNWYDEATGEVLTTWPTDGSRVYPFLSSVDNGWLAAALMVVQQADRPNAALARKLWDPMNFAVFYNPAARADLGVGLLRGGFWDGEKPDKETTAVRGNYLGSGPEVWYTGFHYDTTVSETRIASYIAIARGQVPAQHYFGTWRTFPDVGCAWSWQEQRPIGQTRTYLGIDVFEGAYTYRGMRIVPGWGGSMFESLMPAMFVPEEEWAPRSWGVNHRLTVRAQREHGLDEAQYGYWGFSPASEPGGGYREYGVDAIGLNPDGYLSDAEKTNYDAGYDGCRAGTNPTPTYGDGVVTPHALFLAMHMEPGPAYDNLVKLVDLGAYGEGGFYDAVAVRSRTVAKRYLSLDQAMIMGSIGNVIGGGVIRNAFATGDIRRQIRPLIEIEEFGAGLQS